MENNLRILVTGSDGFIGSHLVEKSLTEGHRVRAFVLYNSFSDIGWLKKINHLNAVSPKK
jgi:nucleoside-diphosphate-sugar epimerase